MPDKHQPTIASPALAVLASAVAHADNPPRVVLPAGKLDPSVYEEVNEVLLRLGGKWKGGKLAAHVFECDPTADLAAAVASGMMPPKNALGFFPTPTDLAEELIVEQDWFGLDAEWMGTLMARAEPMADGDDAATITVLEPSAGRGALIDAVLHRLGVDAKQCHAALRIVAIEIDPRHVAFLHAKYKGGSVEVTEGDFLTCTANTKPYFSYVVMNPPFVAEKDSLAYITHIRRAWELLEPGGMLLAIAPSSWPTRQDRRCREFAAFVDTFGDWFENDMGAFKSSGTSVNTTTIRLRKPVGD